MATAALRSISTMAAPGDCSFPKLFSLAPKKRLIAGQRIFSPLVTLGLSAHQFSESGSDRRGQVNFGKSERLGASVVSFQSSPSAVQRATVRPAPGSRRPCSNKLVTQVAELLERRVTNRSYGRLGRQGKMD